ncbi:MAG: hypothetical protein AAB865_01950 [Patescibacteria group bacterium]
MFLALALFAVAGTPTYRFVVYNPEGDGTINMLARILRDNHTADFQPCVISTAGFSAEYGIIGAVTVKSGTFAGFAGEISPGVPNPYTPEAVRTCFAEHFGGVKWGYEAVGAGDVTLHFAFAPIAD